MNRIAKVGMAGENTKPNVLKHFWGRLRRMWTKETNVYFISGMCYNCSVFDKLNLPEGFTKKYIEWHNPLPDETLDTYVHTMAKEIDTRRPFVLVGYSFGAVIIQEMNRFLIPEKNIIISSFKAVDEIPTLFKAAKRIDIAERIPMRMYSSTDFIIDMFNKYVYHMPTAELAEVMTYTDPVYIKWAVKQITDWVPNCECKNLYHIHGTKDQIFPYDLIKDAFFVEGGDHLMVMKKADAVSAILGGILLMNKKSS